MPEALLALGVLLTVGSALVQIRDEWVARGLTDTSYLALACLTLGPAAIAASQWGEWSVRLAGVGPALAGAYLLGLKLKDRWRRR